MVGLISGRLALASTVAKDLGFHAILEYSGNLPKRDEL
jgi:hypothetical protein